MADGTLHIDLKIRVRGDDVEGCAATDGRPDREFCGWIELLAALDALVAGSGGEA